MARLAGAAVMALLLACPSLAAELRLATMLPRRSSYVKKLSQCCDAIAARTQRRVTIQLFTDGVQGDDIEVLGKIRAGKLDGAIVAGTSLSEKCPPCLLYALPLLFETFEEVDHVRKMADATLIQSLRGQGWEPLGVVGAGFAYILSNAPVKSVDDLKARKLWVPPRLDAVDVDETLGLKAVSMAVADVRNGLKEGVIDAVVLPPLGAILLQWHTRVKCVTDLPLLYSYTLLVVDAKALAALPAADAQAVRDAFARALREVDRAGRDHQRTALEVLRKQRKTFVTPTDQDLAGWRAWADQVTERLIETKGLPRAEVEAVRAKLREFRQAAKRP